MVNTHSIPGWHAEGEASMSIKLFERTRRSARLKSDINLGEENEIKRDKEN